MTYYVISLIIIFNNISPSLLITLTYHLFFNGSLFWYTKLHLSIVGNCFYYIALLRSVLAVILFVGKRTIHHSILLGLISFPLLPLPPYDYLTVSYTSYFWIKPSVGTRKAWWLIAWLAEHSINSTMRSWR